MTPLHSLTLVEVIFGLLRFDAGSFTFESGVQAAQVDHPSSRDPLLAQAENMLVEWQSIEKVVPSLDVWVGLVTNLKGPDVMIDACRTVKELIKLGLVELLDEPIVVPIDAAPLVVEPLRVITEAPSFGMPPETAAPAAPEPSGEYVVAELPEDPIDLSTTTDDIFAGVI